MGNSEINAAIRRAAGRGRVVLGTTADDPPAATQEGAPASGDGGPRGRPVAGGPKLDSSEYMNSFIRLRAGGWSPGDAGAESRDRQWLR